MVGANLPFESLRAVTVRLRSLSLSNVEGSKVEPQIRPHSWGGAKAPPLRAPFPKVRTPDRWAGHPARRVCLSQHC